MASISQLVTLANELRVGALAQPPYCADPRRPLAEVLEEATRNGFDFLPIRSDDQSISKIVRSLALERLADWSRLPEISEPLTADMLVSAEAPALSLLDRLDQQPVLFSLGGGGVEGVITIFDLNQPSAHLLAFGLVLVCEEAVTAWIRSKLGENLDEAVLAIDRMKLRGRGFNRWKQQRADDKHGDLANALTLGEKIAVVEVLGPDDFADRYDIRSGDLLAALRHVHELRNAIAHYDEERLGEAAWVHARMLETRNLARILGA